jgi:hypothetical protein
MKLVSILMASVALNVALSVAYYCRKPASPAPLARPETDEASSSNQPVCSMPRLVTDVITVTKTAEPFDWRAVESEDYRQYVANLRAIGCPEKTLRDIIIADVNDLYRQRARSSTTNRFEYWKPGLLGNAFDEKRLAQQQEQGREKRDILARLLGESYSDQADPASGQIISPMEQMTGDFLSPDKQAAMKALEVKYAGRMLKAAQDAGGEDSDAMRTVRADKDAEMLALLTPDEKFEYDLRLSQPAMLLRMSMGDFEPTEQEFRRMFETAKKFTDRFGLSVFTRGQAEPGAGEVNEMMDEFKAALGEQRFQEFQTQKQGGLGNQRSESH